MRFIEFIKAVIIGIIEGITEWLPVSSTGHMILFDEFVKLKVSAEFLELFLVVIQLGAILAVPILFFDKLNPFSRKKSHNERRDTISLWCKVIVGAMPAAVIGVFLDEFFDKYLYNYVVVAVALVAYGILFIVIEKFLGNKQKRVEEVTDLSYSDALKIGAYQVLALIPGTSRSGSTILGGMLSGVSRTASAEFSFFMAIPIMAGASGYKLLRFLLAGFTATSAEIAILLIGIFTSFLVSLVVIKFLMDFVRRHSFAPFGVYRIILGVLVLSYFLIFA